MDAIHQLTVDGWQRLRAIRLRALRDAPDAFWSTLHEEAAMSPDDWRRRLERPDAATFVVRLRDRDVGLAMVFANDPAGDAATLVSMWVAPEARRLGIASALIDAAMAWCGTHGCRRVLLDVADDNEAAVRFYASRGFRPTGSTGALPPPRDDISEHQLGLEL